MIEFDRMEHTPHWADIASDDPEEFGRLFVEARQRLECERGIKLELDCIEVKAQSALGVSRGRIFWREKTRS